MAQLSLILLMLLSLLYIVGTSTANPATPIEFIKSSCKTTRYPRLCVRSLEGHSKMISHSPRQLAQASLSVSLARSKSAKTFMSKMVQQTKGEKMNHRTRQAVKDCVENVGDAVDRLSSSVKELGRIGNGGKKKSFFMWHVRNVQTWVSAAITDGNTCIDGLSEGGFKDGSAASIIKGRIASVIRVSSNALALVNQFAESH